MPGAWNNDTTLRTEALGWLTAAFREGSLLRERKTPFAVLLKGAPPREAESILGIPVPLAFLIDGLFLGLPSAWGPEWAVEVCQAIPARAELGLVVPGVMFGTLVAVKKLVEDQVELGLASGEAQKQLGVLEEAIEIVVAAMSKPLTGKEEAVKKITRLSGSDGIIYIAQAAIEAVLSPVVADKPVMLDVDKTRQTQTRLANAQNAGMQALAAIRATAQLVVDEARRLNAASGAEADVIRLAEDNARSRFFSAMAEATLAAVVEAPVLSAGQALFAGLGKPRGRPVRVFILRRADQPATAAQAPADGRTTGE